MNTIRLSQQIAFFALAAVVTFSVLAGLNGLSDTAVSQAQQLAAATACLRA